jgi:hypothetical protein
LATRVAPGKKMACMAGGPISEVPLPDPEH